MQEIRKWMFARSLAGHDKGTLYVILSAGEDWLYLTDGKHRLLGHPKKKKRKHAQIDYSLSDLLINKEALGEKICDSDIRKALKEKIKGGNE